jgi:hypothetical protein
MQSAARHLALPRSSSKASKALKGLLGSAALLILVTVLALTGAGSTYAMWNGQTSVNASTVSSASTGLTVNGSATYAIPADGLSKLSPGQSILIPVTLANTGTTKLSTAFTSVVISSDTKSLSSELTMRATQSSTCTASTVAGTRLASFTTTAASYAMAVGASVPVCLEIKMDVDAPVAVAGSTTTFTLNLTATQVR